LNHPMKLGVFLLIMCVLALGQDAAPQRPMRVRVSERVLDGVVAKKVMPDVPCSTDKSHQKGVVTIGVLVDYDGKVKSTSPMSGDSVLTNCAIRAIVQWEFRPYFINGTPVQVESRIVVKFNKNHVELVLGER
jgi:protein TonB